MMEQKRKQEIEKVVKCEEFFPTMEMDSDKIEQ